ncbi:TraB/GumN family protein [soil metagenome]
MLRWLAIFLATLSFVCNAARADDPPPCSGKDLLAELQTKDAAAYGAILDEAKSIPNGDAILWKIESTAQTAPSYLYGTVHLTDPRATALSRDARAALDSARVVALELKEAVDRGELATAAMMHARLLAMPDGRNMWDLIPVEDEAVVRASPNMPPGRADAFAAYQPWVAAAALSVPLCEIHRQTAGLDALDATIGKRALAHHIPVEGLETLEEQLSVFAAMPLDLQARYLVATARFSGELDDYTETMVRLYLSRRMALLMPFARHAEPVDGDSLKIMAFVESDLVDKRNKVMLRRARPLIDGGKAFIAVGALHLPGKNGLVALLRDAGYKMTPVN